MATKTIPEYLEDERRNSADTQLRTEEEAAHLQSLHHGHHRTQKPPQLELPAPVEVVAKARKTHAAKTRKPAVAKAGKTAPAKTRKPAAEPRKKPSVARKTGAKAAKAIKPAATKTRNPAAAARRKPFAARKTATKIRKMA
jgi:hypothetical protein